LGVSLDKILLIGAGGHARSCIDVIECGNKFLIAGLVDKKGGNSNSNNGYSIIGNDDDLNMLIDDYKYAHITVGQIKTTKTRKNLFNRLKSIGFKLPVIISPNAYVSDNANVSEGTIVMHGAIVNAGASIGANCILNSQSLVEHDVTIGDHCHISTGSVLNGNVSVGNGTFIGSGVIVFNDIKIGSNCVISAGVTLKRSIDDNELIK
jgi:sugar O-acyltransferase (sialic acid O-acetyltransferase NeuD family)